MTSQAAAPIELIACPRDRPGCPGHLPGRCTAHKTSGAPCRNYPIHGGAVCATHAGSAPQVKRKAAERIEEARDLALLLLTHRLSENVKALEQKGAFDETAIEYRDLLATVKDMTTQVELLAGRSTQRFEVHEVQPVFIALFQLGIECADPEKRQRFLEGTRELTARLQLPETTTTEGGEG